MTWMTRDVTFEDSTRGRVRENYNHLVSGDDSIRGAKRGRHPGDPDGLGGQGGASGVVRGLLGYALGGVLPPLLAHRPRSHFVERLHDHAVLGVRLQVHDLQVVLLSVLLREVHGFEHVRFLGGGEPVADVVSKDLAVPILARGRFPRYLSREEFVTKREELKKERKKERETRSGGGTLRVCWSRSSTRMEVGGPLGASSAVIMVTVSDGSDAPISFSATILRW